MSKPKRARLSCTTSWQVGYYVDWLLAHGLHGNTRAAVVERLVCKAIEAAVPVEVVRETARRAASATEKP